MNSNSEVNGIVFCAGITGFEGVNFAIDGEYVKKLLPSLYEGGELSPFMDRNRRISGVLTGWKLFFIMPDSPADNTGE